MYGTGLAKGMMLTLRHFIDSYVDDVRYGFRKYSHTTDNFGMRQGTKGAGVLTVQYPDEKVAVPERFRFVPFLVVEEEDHPTRPSKDWCTSCGICAKVCPPQCIWIVRGNDPDTGRPIPEPEAFFIDIDICMNCGFCAEYCPFDAIKMDHDYELASYDRTTNHIHDKERLSKPTSHWQSIAPTRAYEEMLVRGTWDHKDAAKEARRGAKNTRKAAPKKAAAPTAEATAPAEAAATEAPKAAAPVEGATPSTDSDAKREERKRKALERKRLRAEKRAKG
jgi:NADH-quinone oxidoreductase subunit I